MGGGVYQRIADSGINLTDLEIVLLSHLHVDHVGDIDPVVKAMFFHNRLNGFPRDPDMYLHIFGPDNAPASAPLPALRYPTTNAFIDGHFDETYGIEAYLNDFAPVIGGIPLNYMTHNIEHDNAFGVVTIWDEDGLVIKAIGVPHWTGTLSCISYRVHGKEYCLSG